MMRTMSLVALAALLMAVAGSHDLLAKSKAKPCAGPPPKCPAGERFSRQTCGCVPRGAEKQLICHLSEEEVLDEDGEIIVVVTGEVINVSVESAHIRQGKHGDCAPADDAVQGDACDCDAPPAAG